MVSRRIFAGRHLRQLRSGRGVRQSEMAATLGISAAYLSQLENDERPLTLPLADRIRTAFPVEWQDVPQGYGAPLHLALQEAAANPLLGEELPAAQVRRIAEQFPEFAAQFVQMETALRRNVERLEMLDEAVGAGNLAGGRLPWEEVRDWFHHAGNYVDVLDRGAEQLAAQIARGGLSPSAAEMEGWLAARGITVESRTGGALRRFDVDRQVLSLDSVLPSESRRFQIAFLIATIAQRDQIAAIAAGAPLRTDVARRLLAVGLGNYAAGALTMPYEAFRAMARDVRHDIDRLRYAFGATFEQTCHRLSTLQRPEARGTPMFFCRVDMAGNITKRHSATRLQFARFGGACPLWVVHEAVAVPDRIHVQLAEMPDGVRYVSIAKGVVKPAGSYNQIPGRYALALGCEAAFAKDFVYADGLNLEGAGNATPIGASCRICARRDCTQRAFPPNDRDISVDMLSRNLVPYQISSD
ncbi:DUF2083 domain-containing protein [Novosphingobium flavum]|uniref:DUF2083 domain-containing protein n=1 Tax=Novosphingobium flavum TaxID=1778672 RepID=A0A7X1KMI1_9SPHN|nr:helix-turn-helix transcriptional regulator [Novosphingobium flavum]MBC2666671.1 DUF2083 domain-containing protein [Novosphingobium flavum]